MKKSYVQDPVTGKLVEKSEWYATRQDPNAPMVMNDIQPYQSMATGEWITSRSEHRAHLKQHRLVEYGNEKIPTPQAPKYNSDEVKRELARHFYR